MSSDLPVYLRPPIVEAVVSFRFGTPVEGSVIREALSKELQADYPSDPEARQITNKSHQGVSQSAGGTPHRSTQVDFLSSADKTRVLGCSDASLSVHALAPYPGWGGLLSQAATALNAVRGSVQPNRIVLVSVRYIDRIELPPGVNDIGAYFKGIPPCPQGMPNGIQEFHNLIHAIDESDRTESLLRVSLTSGDSAGSVLKYDINLQRRNLLHDFETWVSVANALHARQREVFENSITDQMRSLFQ